MSLDPVIMQGALVALGAIVLLGPAALSLLKKIPVPSLRRVAPSDVDAFVALAKVRDYLGADITEDESSAIEVIAVGIVQKGGPA